MSDGTAAAPAWLRPEEIELLSADFEQLALDGRIKPMGPRLLLWGLHEADVSRLADGVDKEMQDAKFHRVLAIGDGCQGGWQVGGHVQLRTVASTKVEPGKRSCRVWYVHEHDVMGTVG